MPSVMSAHLLKSVLIDERDSKLLGNGFGLLALLTVNLHRLVMEGSRSIAHSTDREGISTLLSLRQYW